MDRTETFQPDIDESGNLLYDPLTEHKVKEEDDDDDYDEDYLVELFFKIVPYTHGAMSWNEFITTPRHILMKMNKYIDKKFEELENEEGLFSYGFLEVLMAISKAFGGKKK